ncbi:MAG: response regulator, partial [Chloroflexota bacterium]
LGIAMSDIINLGCISIAMPNLDGWGFIELIKGDSRTANIPTIALTAHAMVSDREKAFSKGFHNYLPKPLDPFKFLSQILILLDDIEFIASELEERMQTN